MNSPCSGQGSLDIASKDIDTPEKKLISIKKPREVKRSLPESDSAVKGTAAARQAAQDTNWQLIIGGVLLLLVLALLLVPVRYRLQGKLQPEQKAKGYFSVSWLLRLIKLDGIFDGGNGLDITLRLCGFKLKSWHKGDSSEQMRSEGRTLLVSTHIIDSVDMLWDRAMIMQNGEIRANLTREELGERTLEDVFFSVTEGLERDSMREGGPEA